MLLEEQVTIKVKAQLSSLSWYTWTLIFYFNFLFFLPIFFDLIFLFILLLFYFYFLGNEEAHDCGHMMYHITLYHRFKYYKKN